jgi:hypothetical protein
MSLQNVNQQQLTGFVQKVEKTPDKTQDKAPETQTAPPSESTTVVSEPHVQQGTEVTTESTAPQTKTDNTESNKSKFMENVKTETVKSSGQTLSENVTRVMGSSDVQGDRLEQQSFKDLSKGLDKIDKQEKKDKTGNENTPETKKIGITVTGSSSEGTLISLNPEDGVAAKKRDDGEKLEESNKDLTQKQESKTTEVHHEVIHQNQEKHHKTEHAHTHMAHTKLEMELEKEKEAKKSALEAAAQMMANEEEDPTIIKEAAKSQGGGGANNEQGSGTEQSETTQEMLDKMKDAENQEDEGVARTQEHSKNEMVKEMTKEIAKDQGVEKKEKKNMEPLEAVGRVVKGKDDSEEEMDLNKPKIDDILGDLKSDEIEEDKVQDGITHKSHELSQEHSLKHSSLEKIKEKATEELKTVEDVAAMFKILITKMDSSSDMSDGDKEKAAKEIDDFVSSKKFKSLSNHLQDSILSFIDGRATQVGIYKKVESSDSESQKVELGGPLVGITMKTEKNVSRGGIINQISDVSMKPSANNLEASVRIFTQTMPTGNTRMVGDQLFGSALEIKIKPGTTQEQFKASIESSVNKLVTAFTENSDVSHIDRAQLKSALEDAFNLVANNLDKILDLSANNPPAMVKVPISEQKGSVTTGKSMVEIQPRLTMGD